MASRRSSPFAPTSSTAYSPSTNAAVSSRKCAAATSAPASIDRVRPLRAAVAGGLAVIASRPSFRARPKAETRNPRAPAESSIHRRSWVPACAGTTAAGHTMIYSRLARGKAAADFLLRQIAADEHDAAFAFLIRLPRPLMIAVEDHVNALEHETLRIIRERQYAF